MCVSRKCLRLDGTNDYVDTGSTVLNRDELTISAWFRTLDFEYGTHIIWEGDSAGNGWGGEEEIHLSIGNNSINFYYGDGDNRYGMGDYLEINFEIASSSAWHHAAAVLDPGGTGISLYLDGHLVGTDSYSTSMSRASWDTDALIGRPGANERYFQGFIDEVKIYPYARTADQIRQDYAAGLAGVKSNSGVAASFGSQSDSWMSDGLVGYWKFDEPSTASTYEDSSGNGNTGTTYGNASTTAGRFGSAGVFDGSGDYVDVGSSSALQLTGSATWAAWVNAAALVSGQKYTIVGKDGSSADTGWQMRRGDADAFRMRIAVVADSDIGRDSATIPVTGAWYHVVGVYDAAAQTLDIYVNGVLDNGALDGPVPASQRNSGQNVNIGKKSSADNYYWNGQIDEVRIYNRALSADEVRKLYEWAPGPVAWWKFDELAAQTVYDSVRKFDLLRGK